MILLYRYSSFNPTFFYPSQLLICIHIHKLMTSVILFILELLQYRVLSGSGRQILLITFHPLLNLETFLYLSKVLPHTPCLRTLLVDLSASDGEELRQGCADVKCLVWCLSPLLWDRQVFVPEHTGTELPL